jgi:pyruvyltransferase
MLKLFWYSRSHLKRGNVINFGDELSKYLLEKISNETVEWVNPKQQNLFSRLFSSHILGIGSILHFGAKNSLVWGSGLIETNSFAPDAKYFAVRGKYTRNELLKRGYKIPEVYGDPALLCPKYFPIINNNPINKIGIIPHYVEFDDVKIWFDKINISNEVILIDLRKNVLEVLDEINSCSMIISSSLHGIIVPQSYNIPTLRINISDKIYGDDIKYKDYFSSVGIKEYDIMHFNKDNLTVNSILEYFKINEKNKLINNDLEILQNNLLAVRPF